jgi:putative aldouronate transport system substrate-binding protein
MKKNFPKKASLIGLSVLLLVLIAFPAAAGGGQGQSQSGGKPSIEMFLIPWVTTPLPENDPYKKWLDDTTGADWKMTYARDFIAELTTRAAANQMPDLIEFDSNSQLFSMYDQGILLDDWNPYKTAMPQTFSNMGQIAVDYFTKNGKLIGLGTLPGQQAWGWNIRQDWLTKLGLKMPATPDELLAVLRAFTFNDPDGNGANDTYGITACTEGWAQEYLNLGFMYGPRNYYVENNQVTNEILSGDLKLTLEFVKKIIDEGLINPDWATLGWEDRKPTLFQGKYGVAWYPPEALLVETEGIRKDGVVANWWAVLPVPRGNAKGGKLMPDSPFTYMRTVSAPAGKNKAKMDAITKMLEITALPNEEYYTLHNGIGIDHATLVHIGDFVYIDTEAAWKAGSLVGSNEGQYMSLYNYGKMIASYATAGYPLTGTTPQPGPLIQQEINMMSQVDKLPRYASDNYLLNLNVDNQSQANTVNSEFVAQYLLGQTSDYDAFVRRWLAAGGQALVDEAARQFKTQGLIK